MRKRLIAFSVALSVCACGLCVRVLTIGCSVPFAVADQWSTRMQTIAVSRGTIYDRYFTPLTNRSSFWRVVAAPYEPFLRTVQQATGHEIREKNGNGFAVTDTPSAITPTVGVWQFEVPSRYDESLACHTVGYINGAGEGVTGVERACDGILKRYSGQATISYQINALGQLSEISDAAVSNTLGRCKGGVVLTVDAQLQRIVQCVSDRIERGAVVVLSADNAEVLASASYPPYDPDHVSTVLEDPSSPLLDRTMINYNVGSVFKILVAAAALECGIDMSKTYECRGAVEVNGTVFHCHNRLGDGVQTMPQAMADSCNCYFIQLALDIGAQPIMDMAKRAGMDQAFSVIEGLETARGLLPNTDGLKAKAAVANLSIGQGELMTTPYHIAALYKAVADGGIWQAPLLYGGVVDEDGVMIEQATPTKTVRLFSEKTARMLQDMLKLVIRDGTGRAAMPCYATGAGKTGTAQTGWLQNGEMITQSWFAGYYPADMPQYVIVVLSENGGNNGYAAAPVFAYICDEIFKAGLVEKAE